MLRVVRIVSRLENKAFDLNRLPPPNLPPNDVNFASVPRISRNVETSMQTGLEALQVSSQSTCWTGKRLECFTKLREGPSGHLPEDLPVPRRLVVFLRYVTGQSPRAGSHSTVAGEHMQLLCEPPTLLRGHQPKLDHQEYPITPLGHV